MTTKNKTTITAEPGKQELFIIREFDAPRDLVFRVLEEPELMLQWMGPDEMSMEIETFDNRSGGSYRFLHKDPQGNMYAFCGAIHEVARPERVIRTFEFEGLPERGHVCLEILTLEALPGNRTRMAVQSVFRSVADRDGIVASGMERGVVDSYEKLDRLLKRL